MSLVPFLEREDSDEVIAKSILGTEIYSSLVFLEVEAEDGQDKIDELDLQSVVISVSKTKNVVETEVQNRPGTVKEYISDGSYKVLARGVISQVERLVAPAEIAKLLDKHLSLNRALEVGGNFLESFDVLSVVIMDYEISEIPGTRNMYSVRISMVSDDPIELEIGEGGQGSSLADPLLA